jgi:transcriptional regulator CtsR
MHFYQSIGTTINLESAAFYLSALREKGFISPREERLVAATLSDSALAKVAREERGILRADLIKTVILQILTDLEG